MDEADTIKINIGKFFPNHQTKVFSVLLFISLLFSILSTLKISVGIASISQFLSIFPTILLWALTLSLTISTICAYFGKFRWMFMPIIIWLLFTTAFVRISNIPGLKDVTTGDWTLAPDLDPFLYLRHAQEINSGTLNNPDMMRYVPLGSHNYAYESLMPWTIFYIYKISQLFGNNSLTYAAIITPVILFVISVIGFLLFLKTLGSLKFSEEKSWLYAILASLFYLFAPAMLHRTVAGVPEIESLGMVWLWFAFLFIIMAWKIGTGNSSIDSNEQIKEEKTKKIILYGVLAGIFTGLMSWSWGGYRYIYMIFGLATLLMFFFQKNEIKNRIIYTAWIIPALIIIFFKVNSLKFIITNISDTGFGIFVLFLLWFNFILFHTILKEKLKLEKINLPRPITSTIIGVLLLFFALLIVDRNFLINSIRDIFERIMYPFGRARVGLTVAENKVSYFLEVLQNFGYLPWVFILGTVVIFYEAVKKFSLKNKVLLNGFFVLFILGFVFSKYSPSSILDGESFISKLFYLGSLIAFGIISLYLIIKAHIKKDEKTLKDFVEIDFVYILLLAFAFWGIVSMRGAVRLLFIISPILPIVSSFLFVKILDYKHENKNDEMKKLTSFIVLFILGIVMISTLASYSIGTIYSTQATVSGIYEQQWQNAMSWVRENTSPGSVFVHWWDYGYWIQSIGQRPTVTDGGHFISYWPHLIGRYVLTTPFPETALSFMKTHDVSYLLIDSTDLGKYGAYSIIGSDSEGQDRYSQIPLMVYDPSQSRETNISNIKLYQGGTPVDEDIFYWEGEEQIFLPSNSAYVMAVLLEMTKNGSTISQPKGIFIYNQKQIIIPIRYLSYNKELLDFGGGLDATIKVISSASQNEGGGLAIDKTGAVIYLSPKVSKGLFAQLYLLNDPKEIYKTIKLAYSQQDSIVTSLNDQGANLGEFVYFNGFRGPIKIWKVDYPGNIIEREEFLEIDGEYGEFDNLTFTK